MALEPQYHLIPSAYSLNSSWSVVDAFLFKLFEEKFPGENKLETTFQFTGNRCNALLNSSVLRRNKERKNTYQMQSRIDLVMGLPVSSYLWLKFCSDQLKLHYQFGGKIRGYMLGDWQPYASFSSTRKLKNSSFKLGIINKSEKGSLDLRMRYNVADYRCQNFIYAKANYYTPFVRMSTVTAFRKFLQKNDLTFALRASDGHWLGFKLQNDGFRNYKINYGRWGSYFDEVKFVYLFEKENLSAGLLYNYSIEQDESKKIEAVTDIRLPNRADLRIKINTMHELSIVGRGRYKTVQIESGVTWLNFMKNSWPSFYALKLSF